jgi:hypothetical protein
VAVEQFNVRNAILFFGGPAELVRRAQAAGYHMTRKAVEKWSERGQIPGKWLIRLSQMARSEGRNFEMHDFINQEENL